MQEKQPTDCCHTSAKSPKTVSRKDLNQMDIYPNISNMSKKREKLQQQNCFMLIIRCFDLFKTKSPD